MAHNSVQGVLSEVSSETPSETPEPLGTVSPIPVALLSLSGELSGAICLKTLVLLGSARKLFRKFFGAVRAISGFGVLFWLLTLSFSEG